MGRVSSMRGAELQHRIKTSCPGLCYWRTGWLKTPRGRAVTGGIGLHQRRTYTPIEIYQRGGDETLSRWYRPQGGLGGGLGFGQTQALTPATAAGRGPQCRHVLTSRLQTQLVSGRNAKPAPQQTARAAPGITITAPVIGVRLCLPRAELSWRCRCAESLTPGLAPKESTLLIPNYTPPLEAPPARPPGQTKRTSPLPTYGKQKKASQCTWVPPGGSRYYNAITLQYANLL